MGIFGFRFWSSQLPLRTQLATFSRPRSSKACSSFAQLCFLSFPTCGAACHQLVVVVVGSRKKELEDEETFQELLMMTCVAEFVIFIFYPSKRLPVMLLGKALEELLSVWFLQRYRLVWSRIGQWFWQLIELSRCPQVLEIALKLRDYFSRTALREAAEMSFKWNDRRTNKGFVRPSHVTHLLRVARNANCVIYNILKAGSLVIILCVYHDGRRRSEEHEIEVKMDIAVDDM